MPEVREMSTPGNDSLHGRVPPVGEPTVRRCLSRADVPLEAASNLLRAHASEMHALMVSVGGPSFDVSLHLNAFWEKLDDVLPPRGSYYLVSAPEGSLIGTAALRRLTDEVGEMKHLYVLPEARKLGLGRTLIERRIADAREMGLKTLVADSFVGNHAMMSLYRKLGFHEVAPSEDGATVSITPELTKFLVYFRRDL